MERLRPRPKPRRRVSDRTRKLIATAWVLASLTLPVAGAVLVGQGIASLQPTDTGTSYVVNPGDTLTAIALRHGVSVDEIVAANGLSNPNMIYVGQVLVIPRLDSSGEQVHTVRAGESLSLIARRYGVTVDQIAAVNTLPDINSLQVGQVLVLPGTGTVVTPPQAEAVAYTIRRGDSLYRISLIFGITVDDLLAANDLASPNAIYPGLTLRVPAPAAPTSADMAPPTTSAPQTGGRSYTVQIGDTLFEIAIQHQVTVDGLVAANGLSRADRIYAGQVLNIPEAGAVARAAPAQTAVTHRVQGGETLSAIALRYGVTVQALSVANGISNPSRIFMGMILSIPSAQAGSNSVVYASRGPGLCADVEIAQSGTGYYVRPVRGSVITQEFHSWHPGIDLAVDPGTSVYAADGGTVVYAGWNTVGYGYLIVLDHGNGWRTYYAHLSAIHVNCGEWVPRASIIGEVGSTGNSTGPHLHFELLRYGIAVNPSGYIRFP